MRGGLLMWFVGGSWLTLLIAALCMVVAFWFAARAEDRRSRRENSEREYWDALHRLYDGCRR
jgi:protein-S-isoprenylcysteine O-methyltransferase Ste14